MEANAVPADGVGINDLARSGANLFRLAEDLDVFMVRDHAGDLGVDPRDRSELARPVRLVVRPANPRGAVRLPLGRHAEFHVNAQFSTPTSQPFPTPNSQRV